MDQTKAQEGSEGGNKIFLIILMILSVLLIILVLLIGLGVMPGTGGTCAVGSCGDDNPCTADSAANGACSHSPVSGPNLACSGPAGLCQYKTCEMGSCISKKVLNCCGNGICEPPETISACMIDCAGGGLITRTGPGGSNYNEYNTSAKECEPNTGVSDGSICTCEENDCTDGVDNDKDGLIDCYDPDCNCVPQQGCPECEPCDNTTKPCVTDCGTWPSCGGSCVTTAGEKGTCSQGDNECCVCNSIPTTTQYTCESIIAVTGAAPICSQGTCPPNEACILLQGVCGCTPVETPCMQSQAPACGGLCDSPALECTNDPSKQACYCTPKPCADITGANYCSRGACPATERCVGTAWDSCTCVPLDCEDSNAPTCGGQCDDGFSCEYLGNDRCGCEPVQQECGDIDSPNMCSQGTCQSGYECVSALTHAGCDCQPIVQDCSDIRDIKQCYSGACDNGMYCTGGPNGCYCAYIPV